MSQIHTNSESLTLYKLADLVTAQMFSGPAERHHLRKVLLYYQVKSTFLAELNLDYTTFLVFICSFLFVCVFCSRTQTPSFHYFAHLTLEHLSPSNENMSQGYKQPCNVKRDFTQEIKSSASI